MLDVIYECQMSSTRTFDLLLYKRPSTPPISGRHCSSPSSRHSSDHFKRSDSAISRKTNTTFLIQWLDKPSSKDAWISKVTLQLLDPFYISIELALYRSILRQLGRMMYTGIEMQIIPAFVSIPSPDQHRLRCFFIIFIIWEKSVRWWDPLLGNLRHPSCVKHLLLGSTRLFEDSRILKIKK